MPPVNWYHPVILRDLVPDRQVFPSGSCWFVFERFTDVGFFAEAMMKESLASPSCEKFSANKFLPIHRCRKHLGVKQQRQEADLYVSETSPGAHQYREQRRYIDQVTMAIYHSVNSFSDFCSGRERGEARTGGLRQLAVIVVRCCKVERLAACLFCFKVLLRLF